MSIMFLKVRSVSRSRGGNAVAKAAYIARDRLNDARGGRVHDYRRTPGLGHAEIMLPATTSAAATEWARDRATLWNGAEGAERRRDARVAREYTVALPHELTRDARLALAREFAHRIADRYGTAVDLAVHGPTPRGDPRNHHAHILATTRELTADGFGRKAPIELSTRARRELGMPHVAFEYRALRALWAELANEKLREANIESRLEPRSRATLARERTRLAAQAPARDAAAVSRPERPAAAATPQDRALPARPQERAATPEEAQRRAVENWLAYRAGKGNEAPREPARNRSRALEAEFEL